MDGSCEVVVIWQESKLEASVILTSTTYCINKGMKVPGKNLVATAFSL